VHRIAARTGFAVRRATTSQAGTTSMADKTVDIIYGGRVSTGVAARAERSALWLSAEDLERASGWAPKPEGLCKGEVCVPIPPARAVEFAAGGHYNLAALAATLGQPVVHDDEHAVWCFGEAAETRARTLRSLRAPDFTLPDLEGRMHSLGAHRGKKVLLVSWASW
jgi:hypothetical protein